MSPWQHLRKTHSHHANGQLGLYSYIIHSDDVSASPGLHTKQIRYFLDSAASVITQLHEETNCTKKQNGYDVKGDMQRSRYSLSQHIVEKEIYRPVQ